MRIIATIGLTCCLAASVFAAPTHATSWRADAGQLYEQGFVQSVRRDARGVTLIDRELLENDSPGAGASEKGQFTDTIWGRVRARKVFTLEDVRARDAKLAVYLVAPFGKHPLIFAVNGHRTEFRRWNTSEYYMSFYALEFDPAWLRAGRNVVEISCPDAPSEAEGWKLLIARADEFAAGGGDPAGVGKTSFRSVDGGETWQEGRFGPLGQTPAEYSVRVNLGRHARTGWVASAVIDLWRGDADDFHVSQRRLAKLRLTAEADIPPGTKVEYFLRSGTHPSPHSTEWGPFELIGGGPQSAVDLDGRSVRRYVQLRAVLSTENPLHSPALKSARLDAEFADPFPYPKHKNIHVAAVDNPPLRYSSLDWRWEKLDRPELAELRARENLDEVVAGSQTQFEAQVRLLDYATKRWSWQSPMPAYPEWNALAAVQRINQTGGGGMCIQFNNFLAGLCLSFGWQARLVSVDVHEVCEVWNDEFGKWIYLDANHHNHYLYDAKTGVPMSMLDLHRAHLDHFYRDRPIDWTGYRRGKATPDEMAGLIGRGSLTHQPLPELIGFTNAAILRFIPRNNWFEQPAPRPLAHGQISWPWNGYVNWFDERTPARPHYSHHTDRESDLWPTLNATRIHATSGLGNDRLYLQFETYTPGFSHFEVQTNRGAWKRSGEHTTWLLRSGKNTFAVRAVNKLGVQGRVSSVTVNHADAPFVDPMIPPKQ